MSTRTSIRFGSMLQSLFQEKLPQYELAFSETTNQYLLFGYKKPISSVYTGYILIQASRNSGRVGAEVAVTRGSNYPYHRLSDLPDLGVAGYREPIYNLLRGYNMSEDYQNAETLLKVLINLSRECEQAMGRLMEKAVPKLQANHQLWHPLYLEWLDSERTAQGSAGRRYQSLRDEMFTLELLDGTLSGGQFDRHLGPLKYRYRSSDFFNCHLYLLGRAMEFVELPSEHPVIAWQTPKIRISDPVDDPIASMSGRFPQEMSVTLSPITSQKLMEFAFLKSLAALEAYFQLDANGQPTADLLAQPAKASGPLLDAPAYVDSSARPATTNTVDLNPPAPTAPAPPPVEEDDPNDPIAALEARFGLRKTK